VGCGINDGSCIPCELSCIKDVCVEDFGPWLLVLTQVDSCDPHYKIYFFLPSGSKRPIIVADRPNSSAVFPSLGGVRPIKFLRSLYRYHVRQFSKVL
jgi:hypothetical protein